MQHLLIVEFLTLALHDILNIDLILRTGGDHFVDKGFMRLQDGQQATGRDVANGAVVRSAQLHAPPDK